MFSMRRFIHPLSIAYAGLTRAMTLGVRAAAFDAEGRVFLVHHSYLPGWYFPGGGVERGESAVAALDRELAEEGGVVRSGPAELFGFYWNRRKGRARDHVALYVCRGVTIENPPKIPNREIAAAGFFATDELPADLSPATRRRLDEILEGVPRADEW